MTERSEITIRSRESVDVTGVEGIIGFNDSEAVIATVLGMLAVTGKGLKIDEFNKAENTLRINGEIGAVFYPGSRKNGNGFFKRMFGGE